MRGAKHGEVCEGQKEGGREGEREGGRERERGGEERRDEREERMKDDFGSEDSGREKTSLKYRA